MKTLKFSKDLVPLVLNSTKTVTWRMFDDKDLQVGDILKLVNKDTGKKFARAKITGIVVKKLKDITATDLIGHDKKYKSNQEIIEEGKSYYGDMVTLDTMVKIVRFELLKTKNE